jgi:integrase
MSKRTKARRQQGYTARKLVSGNWQFRVSNGSDTPATRTFKTFDAGERWAKPLAVLHKDGKYGAHRLADETLLGAALERYEEEVSILKRGARQEKSRIRMLLDTPLAKKTLNELSTHDFAALKHRWMTVAGPNGTRKLSAATVNRYLALLHHIFETARTQWGYQTLVNPVTDVKRHREREGRDRRISRDEYTQIVRYASYRLRNPYWVHFFRFAIRCPQRKSELLERTWADVDWKECRLRVSNGKTGARYAPLLPGAIKTLRQMKAQFNPRVTDKIFPMSTNASDLIWKQIKKDLVIIDLHWHDLRHEGCSQASILLGFDIAMLQKVSGHKSISQLLRYVNNSMRDVHAAVARKKAERAAADKAPVQQFVDSNIIAAEVTRQVSEALAAMLAGNVSQGLKSMVG